MFKLALSFAALSFLFASPATAADKPSDKWIVTQLSGDARVIYESEITPETLDGFDPVWARQPTEVASGT